MQAGVIPSGWQSPAALAGLENPGTVVLGFSGGADSSSVLDMLLRSGHRVIAVHVNHSIRGEEAERDAAFCEQRARETGAEFVLSTVDVPALAAAEGMGLEEAARKARYKCFADIMKAAGARLLVTAHNADDNAETLLFNIARGCSAKGACGIPPVRSFPEADGLIVRPALRIPKSTLLEYCESNGIPYVTDSTNFDTTYSRNRIRNEIIPELMKINPGFLSSATAFTDSMRTDCSYLDGEAESFIVSHPVMNSKELAGLPEALLSRVLVAAARAAGASPEKRHINALTKAIRDGEAFATTLPGSISARIGKNGILSFEFDPRAKKKRISSPEEGI